MKPGELKPIPGSAGLPTDSALGVPHCALLILLLAAALRAARLGMLEPWQDEVYSIVMARWPEGVLAGALGDTNPPLYLYLLKGWMACFGVEAFAVRALSVVFGVAHLAVLGGWLAALGIPRRAALWAMFLGALAPLHIYYSQEARAYTLSWLLLTLALWSFTAAARSGRRMPWVLHGIFLVMALYTHNLFVFVTPVFLAGGVALGLNRRGWIRLVLTYAVVGMCYLPWLLLTLRTVQGGSLGWIAETWSPARAPLLLINSLEALATGADIPGIIRLAPPPWAIRVLALLWLYLVVVSMLNFKFQISNFKLEYPILRTLLFLVLFVLGPLMLMLGYSLVGQPIYVVGRYDTLAMPALLGLLGLGVFYLEKWLASRVSKRLAPVLVAIIPLMVTLFIMREKLRPLPPGTNLHPQRTRGELLRDTLKPGDLVVCLGLEGARVRYQCIRLGLQPEIMTFPLDTQRHLGYFLPREVVKDPGRLRADAGAILDRLGEGSGRRLVVALDPYSFRPAEPGSLEADYTAITTVLIDAIARRGLREWTDPGFMARARKMGLRIYIP